MVWRGATDIKGSYGDHMSYKGSKLSFSSGVWTVGYQLFYGDNDTTCKPISRRPIFFYFKDCVHTTISESIENLDLDGRSKRWP